MDVRSKRLFMSKSELQSSGKHRRCDFANGACELKFIIMPAYSFGYAVALFPVYSL